MEKRLLAYTMAGQLMALGKKAFVEGVLASWNLPPEDLADIHALVDQLCAQVPQAMQLVELKRGAGRPKGSGTPPPAAPAAAPPPTGNGTK